jgi:hypothetical protein
MKVQDQELANQAYTYMAPFWRENQLVQTKKGAQKKVHDLENQDAS